MGKVLLDNFLFTPLSILVFFVFLGLSEGANIPRYCIKLYYCHDNCTEQEIRDIIFDEGPAPHFFPKFLSFFLIFISIIY